MDSILVQATTTRGVVYIAIGLLIAIVLALVPRVTGIGYIQMLHKVVELLSGAFGRAVAYQEQRYYRDITIGKINEKRKRAKLYRFLNDLIIDLGLKRRGATPYEFLFIVLIVSAMLAALIGGLVGSVAMAIIVYPIVVMAVMCGMYTRANVTHDKRIDDVIEAENIISNNIKSGVVGSIKSCIDIIPDGVRTEFMDFIDNVEHKNCHVETALKDLNNNLGTIADDFIKKCIMFETEEEHGYDGVFRDIVEVNNIKTAIRNDVKRKFEVVVHNFIISVVMVFLFIGGVMFVYDIVREFYLNNIIGNIVLALDALLIVLEFVYITKLRATEL